MSASRGGDAYEPARAAPFVLAAAASASAPRRLTEQVVSFDAGGVSGHPNHVAVARGVRAFARTAAPHESGVDIFELETLGLARKFLGVFDVVPSALAGRLRRRVVVATSADPGASWRAMAAHASQMVWFRKLFVAFSSYTYVNSLRQV